MVLILASVTVTVHGQLSGQSLSPLLRDLASKAVLRLEFTAAGMVLTRVEGRAMAEMELQMGGNKVLWSQGCCCVAL